MEPHAKALEGQRFCLVFGRDKKGTVFVFCLMNMVNHDKETTSSLSHFMGSLARSEKFMGSLARSEKFCPVDTSWHQVKKARKEILLEFIQEFFYLRVGSDAFKVIWKEG